MIDAAKLERLRALAVKATGDGKQSGDWYVVEQPWLPPGAEPYIIAGSPDPHAGLYVCDFVENFTAGTEDTWTEDEWSSRNWAIAEFVAEADPATIIALIDAVRTK